MTSKYAKFINRNNGSTLVYYPVPKNANTSAKLFFAKHLKLDDKFIFLGDKKPEYLYEKDEFTKLSKENLIKLIPTKQKFAKVDADERCCIVREPIERFISAYNNRIIYHKDKEFYNHSIDEVIEKLENNRYDNSHFAPQYYFLGTDINYYTFVCNINNINTFEKKINDFFENNIRFPILQTGGNTNKVTLSNIQKKKLKKIYEFDFDLIKNYI